MKYLGSKSGDGTSVIAAAEAKISFQADEGKINPNELKLTLSASTDEFS
jgi:hypothetical protein